MQAPSVSAAIQSYILGFEKSFEQKSKSSAMTYATTQTATATSQESPPAAGTTPPATGAPSQESAATANANRSLSSAGGIAALLSTQGATVTDPSLVQFINPLMVKTGPGVLTGNASGPPATPSYVANQIIEGIGSNGVLTLTDVENAENGTTGAPTSNSNSDTAIATDFEKLSGGSTTMTATQLANALQSYMTFQH
jgi:hypothetical protein